MSILYKITHSPTNSFYYGIIVKIGKSLEERLLEHLSGAGSKEIKFLILNGADKSEFFIEQIVECFYVDDVYLLEVDAIRNAKQRGEKLLNRNGGGGFLGKKFFYNSSYWPRGWDINIYLDKRKSTPIQELIEKNCTNLLSYKSVNVKRKNSFRFIKYISFILQYSDLIYKIGTVNCVKVYKVFSKFNKNTIINCFSSYENSLKLFELLDKMNDVHDIIKFNHVCEQYFDYSRHVVSHGRCDRDIFFESFFEKTHANMLNAFKEMYGTKINSPMDSDGWKNGREKYKIRKLSGDKTEKEKLGEIKISNITRHNWSILSDVDIRNKTSSGLKSMNSPEYFCSVCHKSNLTKGNLNRWHNKNCKALND